MSAEVKQCPFCGGDVNGDATNYVYHPRHEWCPFSHYTLEKHKWNRRSSISVEVAQELADLLEHCHGPGVNKHCPSCQALARFNAEKGGV